MSSIGVRRGLWGTVEGKLAAGAPKDADLWGRLSRKVDPAEFRPRLSSDIELKEFKLRWGNDYAIAANPRDLIHFRLDPGEVDLMSLMDGSRTVKEIVVERLEETGDLELGTVSDLVYQLHAGNFLTHRYLDAYDVVRRRAHPVSGARKIGSEFVRTLSIEWRDADRLVAWCYRWGLRYLFTLWGQVVSLGLVVAGLVAFVDLTRSHRFALSGKSLALGFLVLLALQYSQVFFHELGHAAVLRHYGRKVISAGFKIYFGSPAFFVDSSESLMLDRGQRIVQSWAGPYSGLMMAGLASVLALAFPASPLSPTLYKFATLAYLLMFLNLIPLLELDGYWMLADLIQVPDLRPRSLTFIRHELWHKLTARASWSTQEVGLALYGILGVLFTAFSIYTSYFFWQELFGGLVARLWHGGTLTRVLLVVLALFVTGPLIRALINLVRAVLRRLRATWRRVKFRLEKSWRVEAADLIDRLPLFDDLPVEALNDLAGRVRLRSVSQGQPVVRQGDQAEAFYVVRRGTLQVVEEDPATGNERVLRTLGRGESFGELALLERSPRTATVRAAAESELFVVDKGSFDRLLADQVDLPAFAPTLQAVAELGQIPCFGHLETDELRELVDHGEWVTFVPGFTIFRQGEAADAFFAIGSGQVEVVQDGRRIRTLGPGSHFGEIALLLEAPRTAGVAALTPVRAYRLGRGGFDRLVRQAFRRGTIAPHEFAERVADH